MLFLFDDTVTTEMISVALLLQPGFGLAPLKIALMAMLAI